MIVAIYMPIRDALLLADSESGASIVIPMDQARLIAGAIVHADATAALARDLIVEAQP